MSDKTPISAGDPMRADFPEIARLIESARRQALQAVNTTLIDLYWQVGAHISRKLETAEWGDGVVQQLADYLARTQPGLRGFTRRNLFRMRQFFEAYRGDEKVSPLVTQIPWTHHLIILSQCKRPEERDFYLRMAVQERWGKRALECRRVEQAKRFHPSTRCASFGVDASGGTGHSPRSVCLSRRQSSVRARRSGESVSDGANAPSGSSEMGWNRCACSTLRAAHHSERCCN